MVGAARNDGSSVEYPAAFPEVMAVAAMDTDAQMSDFSNSGDELDIMKYFLYGCGIHAAQDAFAHSTATKNGNAIEHTGGDDDADEANH